MMNVLVLTYGAMLLPSCNPNSANIKYGVIKIKVRIGKKARPIHSFLNHFSVAIKKEQAGGISK
jgi:hypothetical protein